LFLGKIVKILKLSINFKYNAKIKFYFCKKLLLKIKYIVMKIEIWQIFSF